MLRGCGTCVRLVVARPVDPSDPSSVQGLAPVLPTSVLNNQEQLEAHLTMSPASQVGQSLGTRSSGEQVADKKEILAALPDFHSGPEPTAGGGQYTAPLPTPAASGVQPQGGGQRYRILDLDYPAGRDMPEIETMEVELTKDSQGLGITIAGYTCEREELSGIFVKSVTEGSAADRSAMVMVNDQIVEVDHMSLQGFTNQEAVEMLRSTGRTVALRLVRYVHGLKFEQLQQAIASSADTTPTAPSPAPRLATTSPLASPRIQISPKAKAVAPPRPPQRTDSLLSEENTPPKEDAEEQSQEVAQPEEVVPTLAVEEAPDPVREKTPPPVTEEDPLLDTDYTGSLNPKVELREIDAGSVACLPSRWSLPCRSSGPKSWVRSTTSSWLRLVSSRREVDWGSAWRELWRRSMGPSRILTTTSGQNYSHPSVAPLARSVLPNGPVGQDARLASGDELLEVNGRKLLGLYHSDVVAILKELPMHVRLVCARQAQEERLQPHQAERLVKAKSDGSISSSMTGTETSAVMSRLKSRSLEPLTGLAMWADEVITIELQKTERGLGFSILDYQDPLNPSESVIVIRSLVPAGVAQQDGRLIPGDRLMFVNKIPLENASLDTAVQALKGAPQGLVRIGVAKPLPVPDSQATEEEEEDTEVRSAVTDMETEEGAVTRQDSISSDIPDLPPPLPTSPIPEEEEVIETKVVSAEGSPVRGLAMPPVERLLGSTSKSMTVETRYEERTDSDNIPPLPSALEQKIRILKDAENLGLQVDIEEGGVNGMVVRSLTKGGTLARDGRLQPGDYLVAVGGENMRSISHRDALAVLRRTQLISLGEAIPITYIPASDAVVFRTSMLTRVTMGQEPVQERRSVERQVTVGDVREQSNGTTVISIREKELEQAPLVSPETDMSPEESTRGRSIVSASSSSSIEPEVSVQAKRGTTPPEPAPRSSLRSPPISLLSC